MSAPPAAPAPGAGAPTPSDTESPGFRDPPDSPFQNRLAHLPLCPAKPGPDPGSGAPSRNEDCSSERWQHSCVGKHENRGWSEAARAEELPYQALGVLARPLIDRIGGPCEIGLEVDLPYSGLKLARQRAHESWQYGKVLLYPERVRDIELGHTLQVRCGRRSLVGEQGLKAVPPGCLLSGR